MFAMLAYIFVFLILAGLAYQFICAGLDKKRFGPLGEFINIDGRSLHVIRNQSFGTGPTVILEAGNGLTSSAWMLVQPEVIKFANCLSYDRAGFGFSDGRHEAYSSSNDVKDLHRLLHKLNMPKPYILVGHSYGGMLNRLYANQYPEEVFSIILVDAYHEEQLKIIPLPSATLMNVFRMLTYLGLFRLFVEKLFPLPKTLFSSMRKRIYAEITAYKWTETNKKIFANVDESLRVFKNIPLLDIPMIVISAGMHSGLEKKFEKEITELQKDLVKKSTQGKQTIAEHSGHNVPFSEPEIIVQAIFDQVHSYRAQKKVG